MSSSETGAAPQSARAFLVRSIVLGTLAGIALALLAGEFTSRTLFDTWQRTFARDIEPDAVAVVLIDDTSVRELGSWPWPRKTVAQLVEAIGEAGPTAIGIDAYFDQRDRVRPEAFVALYDEADLDAASREAILNLPDWDFELARVIGSYPTVMARVAAEERGQTDDNYAFDDAFSGQYEALVEGIVPANALRAADTLGSHYEIDGAALSQAMVNGAPDDDGIVRSVPLTAIADDKPMPGFAAEIARLHTGTETLRWEGSTLVMGERRIASDDSARLRFKMGNFYSDTVYSAIDVLDDRLPAGALQDKAVILGVAATGTFDIVATPLGSEVYGALVQANAVDAILKGHWLARPVWILALEALAALVLLGLIIWAALSLRRLPLWTAGAVALALPVLSALLFAQGNLLFDPTRALLLALGAALALWAARYAIARAERTRLAAELVEERVKASKQQGELDAAFKIQMSMVPGEKVLSRLDDRADIAGVLKPAKSVGGDFFDAVKISENQLLFLVGDVTGKGVPAALFMALSKTLSKSNLARAGDGLQEAVSALNFDLMDEADPEMGLTMLIGLIDCSTGEIELVNAGHENPIVVGGDGSVETLAMKGGPPLCVIDFPYPVEPYRLERDQTLVVITDGATEAANEAEELFGMEGVTRALRNAENATASGRASHLADSVRMFEGSTDPTDDLTIFALRYLGSADAAL